MNVRNFAMVLAVVAMSAGSAFAQGDFFWSTSDLDSGATNSSADINLIGTNVGDTGSLFLYYSTASSELDTGAGLDLSWTNDGVIGFTAAETFDFDVHLTGMPDLDLSVRWGDASGAAGAVDANSVTGLNAFTVVAGDGIINANAAGAFTDEGYDAGADAFLFARVDYEVLDPTGSTSLVTQAGAIGIVHDGVTVKPAFGAANFSGIPEPTTAGLLALGLVGLVARRRR